MSADEAGLDKSTEQLELQVEEAQDEEERDVAIPDLEPLSYFGTDFDVHGLVRRLNQKDIVVPSFDPVTDSESELSGFQRKFVWKKTQMDRFIESLLLGFPIPGIFLVQQPNKQLLVLDGQQRLRTLQKFFSGEYASGEEFRLDNVGKEMKGLTYGTLEDEQRRLLDNTFIHATVVKYNRSLGGDESVYSLFERLNTGGTNLYPQEIRVALFHGELVELLRELNGYSGWRSIYGPLSERLKDQELILRFLAFFEDEASYKRPLKVFLNEFLSAHRDLEGLSKDDLRKTFHDTCDAASAALGRRALRAESQVNAAFADAMLVGLAHRLKRGPIQDLSALEQVRTELLGNADFTSAVARATADEERVSRRLSMAKEAFGKVQ
ncbi:DUF262 domain-containing protein [Streptomyces sp. RLB3-17]|uniref:DUF262 domain-containing protein n=1 Tax=Streptomyces sp. RLB3-17 TaxID=2594455 RepID=UPI0011623DF6|nr:DUF262 domain-containing protein [Streptomyces sp. RLB3-17]QDO42537.1 DUF262 domain-containing protein [Streptomyces sp. RLB3-17]